MDDRDIPSLAQFARAVASHAKVGILLTVAGGLVAMVLDPTRLLFLLFIPVVLLWNRVRTAAEAMERVGLVQSFASAPSLPPYTAPTGLPTVVVTVAGTSGDEIFEVGGMVFSNFTADHFLNGRTKRYTTELEVWRAGKVQWRIRCILEGNDLRVRAHFVAPGFMETFAPNPESLYSTWFDVGDEIRFPYENGVQGFLSNGG